MSIGIYLTIVMTMVRRVMSRTVKASEFKAKCLALMDEVANTGTTLVVTKNGKPVADVVPHRPRVGNPLGLLKNEMKITGDLMAPLDVEWDALK